MNERCNGEGTTVSEPLDGGHRVTRSTVVTSPSDGYVRVGQNHRDGVRSFRANTMTPMHTGVNVRYLDYLEQL